MVVLHVLASLNLIVGVVAETGQILDLDGLLQSRIRIKPIIVFLTLRAPRCRHLGRGIIHSPVHADDLGVSSARRRSFFNTVLVSYSRPSAAQLLYESFRLENFASILVERVL